MVNKDCEISSYTEHIPGRSARSLWRYGQGTIKRCVEDDLKERSISHISLGHGLSFCNIYAPICRLSFYVMISWLEASDSSPKSPHRTFHKRKLDVHIPLGEEDKEEEHRKEGEQGGDRNFGGQTLCQASGEKSAASYPLPFELAQRRMKLEYT